MLNLTKSAQVNFSLTVLSVVLNIPDFEKDWKWNTRKITDRYSTHKNKTKA